MRIAIGLIGLTMVGPIGSPLASQASSRSTTQSPLRSEQLVGEWTGSLKFFDAALAERVGELPITLRLTPPSRGVGRMAAAAIEVTDVRVHRDRIEVTVMLDHPPHIDDALSKRHLVLLITSATPSQLTGEAHLKSNTRFDPRMREGYLVLKRSTKH